MTFHEATSQSTCVEVKKGDFNGVPAKRKQSVIARVHDTACVKANSNDGRERHDTTERMEAPAVSSSTNVNIRSPSTYQSSRPLYYLHVTLFAILGCLCRIGMEKLFGSDVANVEDPSSIVNLSFMSNVVGSFILGAIHSSSLGSTSFPAFHKGLTVGFCGCFTTWSKWNQQLNLLLVGETQSNSQPQVVAIMGLFIGLYSFIASYCVGADFGKDIRSKLGNPVPRVDQKLVDILICGFLLIIIVAISVGFSLDLSGEKKVWLAALFAPLGACFRYRLSVYKVETFKFPLGTFLANLIGSVVLAFIHVINERVVNNTCDIMLSVCWSAVITYAIGTGFCASLTTVSSVMGEIYERRTDHPRFMYFYILSSVFACQLLCSVINGVNYAYTTD